MTSYDEESGDPTPHLMDYPRCSSKLPDKSTPSGWTRCIETEGHGGQHWHANVDRMFVWNEDGASRTASPFGETP